MASISTCLFVRFSGHTLLACFSDVLRSVYGQEWYSGVKKKSVSRGWVSYLNVLGQYVYKANLSHSVRALFKGKRPILPPPPPIGTSEKTQSSFSTHVFIMTDPLQPGTDRMLLDRSLPCKVGWMSEMCFCVFFSSQTSVIL